MTVYADGESHSVPIGPNASVYPHTIDTIRLSPKDETIVARLIVAQSGGALRLIHSAEQRELLIDRMLYRGERTFYWAPNGEQLAYANHDERASQPSLWLYTLESQGNLQLWEAPSNGRIDFVTWLPDSSTILFTFIPARPNSSVDTTYYAWGSRSKLSRSISRCAQSWSMSFTRSVESQSGTCGCWVIRDHSPIDGAASATRVRNHRLLNHG